MKKDSLIKLNSSFQKKVFKKLIKKHYSSLMASKAICIPASSIRSYKNLHSKLISEEIIDILIKEKITNKKELNKNILKIFSKKQIVSNSLDLGRKRKKEKFRKMRKELPSLRELISESHLNLIPWIKKYMPLLESFNRKVSIIEQEEFFSLSYKNFSKTQFKDYSVNLPNKISLDDDFSYFFGLWCGDRAGGKRFGICNREEKILEISKRFLENNFQKVEKILYSAEKISEPKIKYNKKVKIKNGSSWVISIHSINGVFNSFFKYLLENLESLLPFINKNAFFAGLFDAEGNVSFYNKSFRWACKDERLIRIYAEFLDNLKLYKTYSGGCLISYDLNLFYEKIFPYLQHPKKIKYASFLCKGKKRDLPNNFLKILEIIKNNPFKTQKELAKVLKKTKVYSELRLLKDFGFIVSKGYPLRFKINKEIKISGD